MAKNEPVDELVRLFADDELRPPAQLLVTDYTSAASDAVGLLARLREVLAPAFRVGECQDPEAWRRALPGWFVGRFAPPRSLAEAEQWVEAWRRAGNREKAKLEAERQWELLDWVHWMRPSERTWRLWSLTPSGRCVRIRVVCHDHPVGLAALGWTCMACGGGEIQEA